MRYSGGRYQEQERVFGGIDEPEDATFSPGPAMRCAKVDPRRVRLFHRTRLLGTWCMRDARIVAWWDLPVVVRGHRVDLLRPRGRLRQLPLDGQDLKTVLPARSGAIFALYSTRAHWRVLRRGKRGDRWTPWLPGLAADFAPTPERLFIVTGEPSGAYKTYGASGPGILWSYGYRNGDLVRHRALDRLTEMAFDSPWVQPGHLASVMIYLPEPPHTTRWFPGRTEVLRLTGAATTLARVPGGWEVHAYDPTKGRLLGLHINRRNMGFDLRWFPIGTGAQQAVADDVDALDVSTESPYSTLVEG